MAAIIEVRNISKEYRIKHNIEAKGTLGELLMRKLKAPFSKDYKESRREERFMALKDVSFDVEEGSIVGIIGRNGAGKSTLLKVLSRITDPSSGSAHIRGRLASLLEVGTGFHPELTGRENIFLNGAILGMRRTEIQSKFREIVAFADIEQFLDTPVKHYSSGMYVRLAFAVAAHLEPEILIVDEVLAVGDMAFQKKCLGKMGEVSRGGRTVLFVSHNMAAVESLCQRGIVLEHGSIAFDGPAKEAVQHYFRSGDGLPAAQGYQIDLTNAPGRKGGRQPLLKRVELLTDGDRPLTESLQIGGHLKIKVHFELPRPTDSFNVGIGFNNMFGLRAFTAHSCFEPNRLPAVCVGAQVYECDIPTFTLLQGDYSTLLWLDIGNAEADVIEDAMQISVAPSDYYGTGKAPWNGACVMQQRWTLDKTPKPGVAELDGKSAPANMKTPVM